MKNVIVKKNTFNKSAGQKWEMVNSIINSCVETTSPNGNRGISLTSDFMKSLVVKKIPGCLRIMDTLYIDPNLISKKQLQLLKAAKLFAETYNFRLVEVIDWFIDEVELPTKDVLLVAMELSFDTPFTSTLWLHTINQFRKDPVKTVIPSTKRLSILTKWLEENK